MQQRQTAILNWVCAWVHHLSLRFYETLTMKHIANYNAFQRHWLKRRVYFLYHLNISYRWIFANEKLTSHLSITKRTKLWRRFACVELDSLSVYTIWNIRFVHGIIIKQSSGNASWMFILSHFTVIHLPCHIWSSIVDRLLCYLHSCGWGLEDI